MTRKDYRLIAQAIRDVYDEHVAGDEVTGALRILTSILASRLAADNDNFDRQKFWNAAVGK
jgi:hypothetical protein